MEKKQFTVTNDLLASQGQRFLNLIIDIIVINIIAICIAETVVIFAQISNAFAVSYWIEHMGRIKKITFLLLMMFCYYDLFETYFARTVGKYFTKTMIITQNGLMPDGHVITFRTLCRFIPIEAFSFLGASARGWHDSISKTYVVKKHKFLEKKKAFESVDEIGNK